jgi:inosose dehydratase
MSAAVCREAVSGPGSFGVEQPRDPRNPGWKTVLDAVADAGYTATEVGPRGWLPGAGVAAEALRDRGLRPVATFLDLSLSAAPAVLVHAAASAARWLVELGGDLLVIVDHDPARQATAGRRADARPTEPGEWRCVVEGARWIADATARCGVTAVIHPHAGTRVEFGDEIDALAEAAPDVRLCLDTGHAAYCGDDPVALLTRHAERLSYLHLKDVDLEVVAAVHERAAGFTEAVKAGVFVGLGEGHLDFVAIASTLDDAAVACPTLLELDVLPGATGHAAEHAARSLQFARDMGLANPTAPLPSTPRTV